MSPETPVSPEALVEQVRGDLASAGLAVEDGPSPSVISIDASGRAGQWTTFVWVREAEAQVVVHGVLPWWVPEGTRDAVATYLTLANFGLVIGNFEIDLSDGEVRYKTSLDFEGCEIELQLVRNIVAANLRTVERYLPGMAAVANGADPHAAIAAVESGTEGGSVPLA